MQIQKKMKLDFNFENSHLNLSLQEKVSLSKSILKKAFKKYNNPILLFSGGVDSILMLFLALEVKPDLQVLYIDTRMNFPDFNDYLEEYIKPKVKNFIHKRYPLNEGNFIKNYGVPIYPGLEEIGYGDEEFFTLKINKACSVIKKKIIDKEFKNLKPNLTIIGFLATDKDKRMNRLLKNGYLEEREDENLLMPIAMFRKEDIFDTLDLLNIKFQREHYFYNNILVKGDGVCWMCSAKCFINPEIGNWELLKNNYPELWKKLNKEYKLKEKLEEIYSMTKNKKIKNSIEYLYNVRL